MGIWVELWGSDEVFSSCFWETQALTSVACCVLSRYTESRGILSQLTAEMSTGTNTTADSPRSVFSRENQDHKGRGRKLPECVGALPFFLVSLAICSSWLMEEKLKSQETKCLWYTYWMHLDTPIIQDSKLCFIIMELRLLWICEVLPAWVNEERRGPVPLESETYFSAQPWSLP